MEPAQIDTDKILKIFLGALLCICLVSLLNKNNQVVRPVPFGPPAPLVPQLPDLVARLSKARTLCEERARSAISTLSHQRGGRVTLKAGRKLYDEAQAEFNGAIDYLRCGLARRFVEGDAQQVAVRMTDGERKVDEFVAWANSLEETSYGATIPTEFWTEFLGGWIKLTSEQNDRAIEQLRSDLDACRIKGWNDILNSLSVPVR